MKKGFALIINKNKFRKEITSMYYKFYDYIAEDQQLKPNEKIVFSLLTNFTENYDMCFPSNKLIAKKCGISEETAKRIILSLKEKHYITTWKIKIDDRNHRVITTNNAIIRNNNDLSKLKRESHKEIKKLFDYDWLNERE